MCPRKQRNVTTNSAILLRNISKSAGVEQAISDDQIYQMGEALQRVRGRFQYSSLWHPLSVARVTNRTDVIVQGNEPPLMEPLMEVSIRLTRGIVLRSSMEPQHMGERM